MGVGSREKPDQFVSECGSVDLDLADEGCTGKPCGTGTLHIVEFRVAAEAHLRERSVLLEDRTAKPGGTGTTCAVETARSVNGRVHELNVTDKRCVFEPSVTDVAFAEIKVYKGCVSQVKVDIRPKDVPRGHWAQVVGQDLLHGDPHLALLDCAIIEVTQGMPRRHIQPYGVRHSQVGAQQADNGLSMSRVILGEALECIQTGQSYGRLVRAQLISGLRIELGDTPLCSVFLLCPGDRLLMCLVTILLLQSDLGASLPPRRQQQRCAATRANHNRARGANCIELVALLRIARSEGQQQSNCRANPKQDHHCRGPQNHTSRQHGVLHRLDLAASGIRAAIVGHVTRLSSIHRSTVTHIEQVDADCPERSLARSRGTRPMRVACAVPLGAAVLIRRTVTSWPACYGQCRDGPRPQDCAHRPPALVAFG